MAKRLEFLREMVPAATRVVVLVSPHNASNAAFATLARERSDVLFVDPNPFFVSRRIHLVNLASRLAVPAIYFDRAFAESAG